MSNKSYACPKCGTNRVEEVMYGVMLTSEIKNIDSLQSDGYPDYDLTDTEYGEIERFQCWHCGYILKEENGSEVRFIDDLIEWIDRQKAQAIKDEKITDG